MFSRWKHPCWQTHVLGIVQGFAEILDGAVTVVSLGFFMSQFELSVATYRALYKIKRTKPVANISSNTHFKIRSNGVPYTTAEEIMKHPEFKRQVDAASKIPIESSKKKTPKPFTDEELDEIIIGGGIYDCVNDPWDYNDSGDNSASLLPDLRRLCRKVIEEYEKRSEQ